MKFIKKFESWYVKPHTPNSDKDITDINHGSLFYNKNVKELMDKFYSKYFNDDKSPEERFNSDIKVIIEFVEKNCQEFIKDYRDQNCNGLIYRGSDTDISNSIKNTNLSDKINNELSGKYLDILMVPKKSRENRKPLDTPTNISNMIDDSFEKKFGIRLRSKGVFGTGSPTHTHHYGYPWIIIPCGQYKLYWSNKIDDLFGHLQNSIPDPTDSEIEDYIQKANIDENQKIKKYFDRISNMYIIGNLKDAIASNKEVTFICNDFILINSMYAAVIEDYLKGNYKIQK